MYNQIYPKKLVKVIYSVTLALVIALPNSMAYGKDKVLNTKNPYIFGFVQSPPTRARDVTHSFHVQLPPNSGLLSQITVDFPYGLRASKNVSVSDDSNRKINTSVFIEGKKVTLIFPQPVAPGSTLEIKMKDIFIVASPSPWVYSVYAKFVGLKTDVPIGLFQIRAYR